MYGNSGAKFTDTSWDILKTQALPQTPSRSMAKMAEEVGKHGSPAGATMAAVTRRVSASRRATLGTIGRWYHPGVSNRACAAPAGASRLAVVAVSFVAAALSGCADHLIRLGGGPGTPDAADTGPGIDGVIDTATSDAAPPCPHATVRADEVLWIGDSWMNVPGNAQATGVRDMARAKGAIGPNDDYTVTAMPGARMSDIASQYTMQEAMSTKVKVLIMDGGTIDTITAQGSDASVSAVVMTFNQFLANVANDGTVKKIVYVLMPELPAIDGVAALRPPMQQACATSAVPCYFLDLQKYWSGHPEYTTMPGGIPLPTDAGARVIATQLWTTMLMNCIAQ